MILAYAVATCANASEYYRTVAGNAQPSPMLRTRDYNMESPEWAPAMVPPAYPTGIPMCVCVCVCVCVRRCQITTISGVCVCVCVCVYVYVHVCVFV